jgi:thymidine phosphorylase
VQEVDALAIGLASVAMGAGRTRADQPVDHQVGISVLKKPGAAVQVGDVLARLHVRDAAASSEVAARVAAAFSIGDRVAAPPPLVLGAIRSAT